MGIDIEIFFESLDGKEPTDAWLPSDYEILESRYQAEKDLGATHRVYTLQRYYGKHYERGSWPNICGCLMSLFASTNVGKVWYFGDSSAIEDVQPITIEDVLAISRHYMLNGERPYRQDAKIIE